MKTLGSECEFDAYGYVYLESHDLLECLIQTGSPFPCLMYKTDQVCNNITPLFTGMNDNSLYTSITTTQQNTNCTFSVKLKSNKTCSDLVFTNPNNSNIFLGNSSSTAITIGNVVQGTYSLSTPLITTSCSSNSSPYSPSNFIPSVADNKLIFTPQNPSSGSITSLDTNASRLVSAVNNALSIIGDINRSMTYESEFYCDGANPLVKIVGMECLP